MTITPTPNHRGDPRWLPEVLRAYGVTTRELPGWLDWGMGDFGVIQGIVVHHTGHNATSAEYIARNPGLGNGLSSQIQLSRDGVATLCGAGIAWHAGRGSHPGWPTNDANRVSIGIEAQSDGTSAWPQVELDAYYRICAAILYKLGKRATPQTLISHWEYSLQAQGKWDPGAGNGVSGARMEMGTFRARVNWHIDNPPWQTAPAPKETPVIFDQITTFIKGYLGPQIDAIQEIWRQLRGPGGTGWPQLGKNAAGQNLSLVDAIAAIRQEQAAQRTILEKLSKGGK